MEIETVFFTIQQNSYFHSQCRGGLEYFHCSPAITVDTGDTEKRELLSNKYK
jgi:hypothetical protein